MKKFLSIIVGFLILGVTTYIGLAQRYGGVPKVSAGNPCNDFHRKACPRSPDDGFAYNGQSRSGLFAKGQLSTVKAVLYKGMDYHFSVCTEDASVVANFIMKDAKTNEVLYDNATDNNTQEIQITNQNTRTVNLIFSLPGNDGKDAKDKVKGAEGMCAGLLIEHKRSDKTGF